jgi:hypothetical protein
MTAEHVNEVWEIAILIVFGLFFLFSIIIFQKKIKTKKAYAIAPTLMILSYVVGWILILNIG